MYLNGHTEDLQHQLNSHLSLRVIDHWHMEKQYSVKL